jgi:probable HAF family extracellular repeat protein
VKSKGLLCITVMTLFAALAIPTRVTAQEQAKENRHVKHHHYKLIDIETFGGPESYVWPFYSAGSHNTINKHGVTVGAAGTAIRRTPKNNPFMCGGIDAIAPFVNHALELQNGVVTDLGSLAEPDNCSVATSINARGEVTGQSENGVIDPVLGFNELRAVLWKNGEIFDLGTLGGDVSVAAGNQQPGRSGWSGAERGR